MAGASFAAVPAGLDARLATLKAHAQSGTGQAGGAACRVRAKARHRSRRVPRLHRLAFLRAWKLVAHGLSALTGDHQYDHLVDDALTPAGIAAERQKLKDEPYFEMPYGRAWFLRLAIAHAKKHGKTYVTDMADDVARSIYERYRQTGPRPFELEYANPAWAMINLLDYIQFRKTLSPAPATPLPDREALVPLMRPFLGTSVKCSLQKEIAFPQFMSICGNWAALIAMWLPPDEARATIDKLIPDVDEAMPVTKPQNAHHYGLNFTRAWSAWIVYSRTGDKRWAAMFARHMEFMDAHPEWWSFDYGQVGHWVAQFGIFAWERFLTDPVKPH